MVGTVTSVWGGVSHGRRGKEKLVVFRCGPVRRGELSRGMAGKVGRGLARRGAVKLGMAGLARRGRVRQGTVGPGMDSEAG